MKVKEESEKVGLKLNIQKTKVMVSGPIASWEIDGETVADLIFLGSNIIADGDCSHEIKRHLLLGRKVMTKLDSILKSRNITLSTKVCLVKATVLPVDIHGCESWTIKKADLHSGILVCIPTNRVGGFPFLHTLSSIYCLQIFGSQPFWLVWSGTSLWFWFAFL